MSFRKVNLMLIGIMAVISMIILASTLTALYQSAFKQSRENLNRIALSQVRLLESLAVFDRENSSGFSDGSLASTLAQIDTAFKSLEKIGETGEFLLAQKQSDEIDFLLISPGGSQSVPDAVRFVSELAEPMRRALNGKGGIMTGQDYDGVSVLAAYQPVKKLNFGIVVKIDIAEVRAPFLRTGGVLVLFSVFLTAIGSALFLRVNNPMILRIKESEQRYQRAIAGARDGIWDWNIKTDEQVFSPRWAEILGYDFSDLKPVAQTFTNLVHPDDWDTVWHNVQEHLDHKTPYDIEFRMRKKNGRYIWVQCKGSASWDEDGQATFMAGSLIDITNRKLNEDKLRIAKVEAEQANLAKSEFLSSMSHELRTPLNAILGFGQMLQINPEEVLTEKQNEYVEHILTGGDHLLTLINEILDLSQIEADQASISLDEVDAEEVVKSCISQIAPLGKERGINIINQVEVDLDDLLRTDQMRFKQIMINLLSNAVKYNKDGGTITVDCRKTKAGFLHISVTDTGIGIAEKDHVSVFDMFKRVVSDSDIAREGTGIGLTICKLLAEQLGGRIGFESRKDQGSTFWIELPLLSNKGVLIWNDSLRVGVDPIDKDHQIIVALNNRISSGNSNELNLDNIIIDLIDYTQHHFRREETIMEICGYPQQKKHRAHHQKLIAKVDKLANDWRVNNVSETRDRLSFFLRDWWVGHIMKVDTDIMQYTQGKQQEIRVALKNLENI